MVNQPDPATCQNFKVTHPKKGKNIPAVFFAVGKGSQGCQPYGVLTNDVTSQNFIGETEYSPQPPDLLWAIFFKVTSPDPRATYTLNIYQTDAAGRLLATVKDLKIALHRDITIITPTNDGDPCCSDPFQSQGTLSAPDTTIQSATLTPSVGSAISRTRLSVKGTAWLAVWSSISDGIYDLNVAGNVSGQAQKSYLDIQAMNC